MKIKVLLFCFIFSFNVGGKCVAQMAEGTTFIKRRTYACESLQKINEGFLIVRLTSNAKKIEQLELLKKGKSLSKKRRKKYAEQLKELKEETRQENELVVAAFMSEYDFSEVLFMFDTATNYLTQGVQNGYFLNHDLEVDSSIELSGRDYFLVKYGFIDGAGQKRTKGLVVMNADYEIMPPPFPYKQFQRRRVLKAGEDEREELSSHIKMLVRYMGQDFGRYLNKCRYKGWNMEERQ